ncbi:hypothetical protein HHI36_000973 [Cryptolaemus montrouzieri]|uniref:Uncharacterized protein n=1 Tax=Cryptolaemus montrouzieri TaxID=559131 RepID=A0ABD2P6W8_9CUCU
MIRGYIMPYLERYIASDVQLLEKFFSNLMLEVEEADEVLIIPQQNASSDVESECETDNEDEYAPFSLQSEFEAPNSTNVQTVQPFNI